jgi:hypothetical protein
VSQGLVLEPLLFSLYVAPIADVITSFDVSFDQYANDNEIYTGLSRVSSLSVMNDCFDAVHRLFTLNGVSLNPRKSEATVGGTDARQRREGETGAVRLDNTIVTVPGSVRLLEVTIVSTMSFDQHVQNICKGLCCYIRALHRIRKILSLGDIKSIARVVVSSRLDYCNALLYGVSATNVNKLQRVQNTLARLVVNERNQSHVVAILADLLWLPVSARICLTVLLCGLYTRVLSAGQSGGQSAGQSGGLSAGLSAVRRCVRRCVRRWSVEESVLLSAGPDSGHFNGLSAGLSGGHVRRTVRRTRGVAIKSCKMIT